MFDQLGIEKLTLTMQHPSTHLANSPRYVATIWHDSDRYGTLNRRVREQTYFYYTCNEI
jgi:hypothetical protein